MEKSRMAELKWDATYVGLIIITSHGNKKIKKHTYDVMLGHEVSFKSSEYLLGLDGFPI